LHARGVCLGKNLGRWKLIGEIGGEIGGEIQTWNGTIREFFFVKFFEFLK